MIRGETWVRTMTGLRISKLFHLYISTFRYLLFRYHHLIFVLNTDWYGVHKLPTRSMRLLLLLLLLLIIVMIITTTLCREPSKLRVNISGGEWSAYWSRRVLIAMIKVAMCVRQRRRCTEDRERSEVEVSYRVSHFKLPSPKTFFTFDCGKRKYFRQELSALKGRSHDISYVIGIIVFKEVWRWLISGNEAEFCPETKVSRRSRWVVS